MDVLSSRRTWKSGILPHKVPSKHSLVSMGNQGMVSRKGRPTSRMKGPRLWPREEHGREKRFGSKVTKSRMVAQCKDNQYRNIEGETHRRNNDDKSQNKEAKNRKERKDNRST